MRQQRHTLPDNSVWSSSGIPVKVFRLASLLSRAAVAGACLGALAAAHAEEIGSVNTNFRFTGSDRVVVEAYDDPQVKGVTCYVSRARTGGVKGTLGIAEDPTEASIACRQVGPLSFTGPLRQQSDVFSERMSFLFKTLHVVRVVDAKRNALVYLTYSDRVVSGSAKNSVSAVPVPPETAIPLR
ncbi:MAG: CREA signal peptide protein [Paraburkholderia sp.]|nr:MAG: CREA signal peptide protein [Paraburkholderia sp.]TAM27943.1 MAG: CREA signal peptide protein [Paraburkholderia sp.]